LTDLRWFPTGGRSINAAALLVPELLLRRTLMALVRVKSLRGCVMQGAATFSLPIGAKQKRLQISFHPNG
jgi:hypothetical protein